MGQKFLKYFLLISCLFGGTYGFSKDEDLDTQFPSDWFLAPDLSPEEKITSSEGLNFVNQFFDLTNKYIFDPNFRLPERKKAQFEVLRKISTEESLTRSYVHSTLHQEISKLSLSHFYIFDPPIARRLMGRASGNTDSSEKKVKSYFSGNVGVLKIGSFLVPEITKVNFESEYENLRSAKAILVDLRGNGGGSNSSVSYSIQSFLGPDKSIFFIRNRDGLSKHKPFIMKSFYEDILNTGSSGDIDLVNRYGYVEWRTSSTAIKDKRPIYLLINSTCGSSCEIFAMALKEHGSAKIIGTTSAGAVLGATAYKPFWKGYLALIPYSQILSPKKKLYEGVGVAPDIHLSECSKEDDNKSCLEKALQIIESDL